MYNPDQHNMEGCPASPPSSLSQWDSPSSIPPPTPFPNCKSTSCHGLLSRTTFPDLDLSWAHSFNDPGSGFRSASYSDGFTQDPLISANTQLPGPSYFDDFPIIGEGSSGSVVGNPPEFPSLFTHAETAHLSRGLPAGVIPGPHSRSEHEEPLSPPTGQFQTRGYPMHSYESPLSTVTEDMDYKKNPELMRSNWMADYGRFVDSSKVFKIFSKHAKEKVATINTIKASAARRTNPAKFKCQIRGCNADFTRKHNLESEFDGLYILFLFSKRPLI